MDEDTKHKECEGNRYIRYLDRQKLSLLVKQTIDMSLVRQTIGMSGTIYRAGDQDPHMQILGTVETLLGPLMWLRILCTGQLYLLYS